MSSCCRRVFLSPVFPHPKGPSAFTHKPLIRRQNPAGKALAHPTHLRTSHTTSSSIMASAQSFSNTSTGSKPADPYKSANKDEDVAVVDKVEDLSKFIDNCKYGMMTTHESASGNLVSRCMALAAKETGGIDLLFHTNTESGKTDDIATDPHINIAFLDSFGQWASISGTSEIITDRELVKKHYTSTLKAWVGDLGDGKHDGGPEDPRIGVIRVRMISATYAISHKNIFGRAAEVAQGTVTGKAAHVNKLREISKEEVQDWRKLH